MLRKDTWREVIKAIEDSLPLYDQVNELVSLGRAERARRFAIQRLDLSNGVCVLDGGIGPGNMSRLVLSAVEPRLLVGLDESTKQLKGVKKKLGPARAESVELVRGIFESLPFRDETLDVIVTSYALRDSLDVAKSVSEYSRVCKLKGRFAVVDIGKPDNGLKRFGSMLYMRFIVPLIAKIATGGKIRGNPWRMLYQTYLPLSTNRRLLSVVKRRFAKVELKEFLMGGVIVILAQKSRF